MFRKVIVAAFIVVLMSSNSFSTSLENPISNEIHQVEARQGSTLATNFTQMDQDIQDLYDRWQLQGGLQAAIYYNGSLVYAKSFGYAETDENSNTWMQNYHRFRIASLSKAITGAAIQTLVASGEISLNDKMVDLIPHLLPDELEDCEYPNHSGNVDNNGTPSNPSDDVQWGIENITVAHLLNMRSGLDVDPPNTGQVERETTRWHWEHDWMDDDSDYQGKNNSCIDDVAVAQEYNNGLNAPVKIETTIRETLRLPLNYRPGTSYNYSNLVYRILGEIIEAKSGMDYEDYVRDVLLAPMGIENMQTGKTKFEEKAENEVTYYSRTNATWYSYFPLFWDDQNLDLIADEGEINFGDSSSVPMPYGGSAPMEELEASGGWIANAASYARIIAHVDGTLYHPGFIDSFNFSTTNPFGGLYGSGINPKWDNDQTWVHAGALDGTSTRFERRLVDGESVVMVLLSNTRPGSAEQVPVGFFSPQQTNWSTDRSNVMTTAFTTIDYKNLSIVPENYSHNHYDPFDLDSECPPGTSETGGGAHVLIFKANGTLKCYYNDQYGKKGPVYDDESGYQVCPEGTSTSGVGEHHYKLWNKDGGYIICYLDDEYLPEDDHEEDECPDGKVKDENGRCVELGSKDSDSQTNESREDERIIPSIGVFATILCVFGAVFLNKRYNH